MKYEERETYLVLGWELSEFFEYDAVVELADIDVFLNNNINKFKEWSKQDGKIIGFITSKTGNISFINDVNPAVRMHDGLKIYVGYIQKGNVVAEIDSKLTFIDCEFADLFVNSVCELHKKIAPYFIAKQKKLYLVKVW